MPAFRCRKFLGQLLALGSPLALLGLQLVSLPGDRCHLLTDRRQLSLITSHQVAPLSLLLFDQPSRFMQLSLEPLDVFDGGAQPLAPRVELPLGVVVEPFELVMFGGGVASRVEELAVLALEAFMGRLHPIAVLDHGLELGDRGLLTLPCRLQLLA